jgi:hypothetical protein
VPLDGGPDAVFDPLGFVAVATVTVVGAGELDVGGGVDGGDGVGCGEGRAGGCGRGGWVVGPVGGVVEGADAPGAAGRSGAASATGTNGLAASGSLGVRPAAVVWPPGAGTPAANDESTERSCDGGSAVGDDAGCLTSSAWRQKCAETPAPTPTTVAQRNASAICFTTGVLPLYRTIAITSPAARR